MNMLAIHGEAASSVEVYFHNFLLHYSSSAKEVYGFVEGKEDPSFYRIKINDKLPKEWRAILWPVGKKSSVVALYSEFDWSRFSKKRIVFFIDRDLSDFTGDHVLSAENVYVTDGYSIENDIVTRETCENVLLDLYGLYVMKRPDIDSILDHFDSQKERFISSMSLIMAWIIQWRIDGETAHLNNIQMKKIFRFVNNIIEQRQNPGNYPDEISYIHHACRVPYRRMTDINRVLNMYMAHHNHLNLVRGKYLMWFFIEFILTIINNIQSFSTIPLNAVAHLNLCQSNGVTVVGLRARIPESLNKLIDETFVEFVASTTN